MFSSPAFCKHLSLPRPANWLFLGACAAALINLATAAEYNAACSQDSFCWEMYTHKYNCEGGHCIRGEFTNTSTEMIGYIVIIGICMVANAGGLGAGAVIIPVYMFMYDFSATDSIPLSKITICAGAIVNFILSWKERDRRNTNRFLINYNMAAVIVPLLLAGTQIGVALSRFLPPALIVMGLVAYLFFSVKKMYERGVKEYKKEQAERLEELGRKIAILTPVSVPIPDTSQAPDDQSVQAATVAEPTSKVSMPNDEELPTLLMMRPQYANFGFMILALAVTIITTLMRGGEGAKSIIGIKACSGASNILFIFAQFLLVFVSIRAHRYNKEKLDQDDIEEKGAADRVAAGSLGIGGGMVLGPFMLALGMDAVASTALSGFIVLFTSTATSTAFSVAGAIHLRHAVSFMFYSLIGSFGGNYILKALVKKYKRPSILVWVVFAILLLASFVLPVQLIYKISTNPRLAFAFGALC